MERVTRDERALVLNVTYEPISVVSQRRAMVLVVGGKAESVHGSSRVFRSERLTVVLPSVVRLSYMVRVPYRRSAALNRRALFARDNAECQYCGARADGIDHVVPRSRGGEHTWENVVACCRSCNITKGDRYLHDMSTMKLRRVPSTPPAMSWVAMSVPSLPLEWREYLPGGLPATA